jgi:L-2,4-diaminobutyrate transaminase
MRAAVGEHPLVGEIRGTGLMLGVELVKDRATKEPFPKEALVGRRLLKNLLGRGLISRALGDTLVFAPPLVIERRDIDELVSKFKAGLEAIALEVR